MKLAVLIPTVFGGSIAPSAPGDCQWLTGGSGQHAKCLPGFFIDGTCGSGSREDCRFSRESGDNASSYGTFAFGIHW